MPPRGLYPGKDLPAASDRAEFSIRTSSPVAQRQNNIIKTIGYIISGVAKIFRKLYKDVLIRDARILGSGNYTHFDVYVRYGSSQAGLAGAGREVKEEQQRYASNY